MQRSDEAVRDTVARGWFGVTALLAFAGMAISLVRAYRDHGGPVRAGWPNLLNSLAYFTDQSTIVVGATCLLLALDLRRASPRFCTARLTGVTAIVITGIVYRWLLAGDAHPAGWARVQNLDLHTAVPIAAVVGFLLFGPRGAIAPRTVAGTLVFLLAWAAFTFVRGAVDGWYPYGFIDATAKGYPAVLLTALGLAAFYLAVGGLLMGVDRGLARR